LDRLPDMPEWLDPALVRERGWPDFVTALRSAHYPATTANLDPDSPHVARVAFDELSASQLALALTRAHMRRGAGRSHRGDGRATGPILAALPFSLTPSQETALGEIAADLAAPERMLRLLQGDVGSGKTVVALLAMAGIVEAGAQAALM